MAESGEEQAADLAGLSQEDAYKMLKEQGLFLQKEQLVNSMEVPGRKDYQPDTRSRNKPAKG